MCLLPCPSMDCCLRRSRQPLLGRAPPGGGPPGCPRHLQGTAAEVQPSTHTFPWPKGRPTCCPDVPVNMKRTATIKSRWELAVQRGPAGEMLRQPTPTGKLPGQRTHWMSHWGRPRVEKVSACPALRRRIRWHGWALHAVRRICGQCIPELPDFRPHPQRPTLQEVCQRVDCRQSRHCRQEQRKGRASTTGRGDGTWRRRQG